MSKNRKIDSMVNKTTSVFIATFAHYEDGKRMRNNGMIESLLFFFLPKVHTLHLVVQPHPGSDRINPEADFYEMGALKKKISFHAIYYLPIYLLCLFPKKRKIRLSYKIRDIFSVLSVALIQRKKYDYFIGLEAVNLLAGLVLKKLGIVKQTIYYVSDYSPRRFKNKLFNEFYIRLDRFALRHADFTWDVSEAMQRGRIEAGLPDTHDYRVIHVPNALFPSQIAALPIEKRKKYDLVYMGILEQDMGPDLALRALKIVRERYPHTRLHLIGGPTIGVQAMKILARKLKVDRAVIFYGFVPNDEEMSQIVRHCFVGLAPYRAFSNSKRWYGDAGKIRQYIASGLPIVTTQVPPLGKYIVNQGAGIMTKDTEEDFSNGIIRLFSNPKLYNRLASNAENISKDNTWENVYLKAFLDMDKFNQAINKDSLTQ